jgi:hypothetical protein
LSARRLNVLLRGLSKESALFRSVNPALAMWDQKDELLASIAELIDANTRTFIRAHSDKSDPQPKPLKITRPHRAKEDRRGTSMQELQQMFPLKPRE